MLLIYGFELSISSSISVSRAVGAGGNGPFHCLASCREEKKYYLVNVPVPPRAYASFRGALMPSSTAV